MLNTPIYLNICPSISTVATTLSPIHCCRHPLTPHTPRNSEPNSVQKRVERGGGQLSGRQPARQSNHNERSSLTNLGVLAMMVLCCLAKELQSFSPTPPSSKQTPQRIHHYIYHIILTPLHHLNVHLFHYNVESENTAEITASLVASQPPTHTLKTEYFQIITGVDRPRNIPLHICAYIHHIYIAYVCT